MRTRCSPSRSCQFSASNFMTGYSTKFPHMGKLDSMLVNLLFTYLYHILQIYLKERVSNLKCPDWIEQLI